MTEEIEIEAKFTITDPNQLAALRQAQTLFNRYPLFPAERVIHTDAYFDTTDFYLLRNGQTLRLRRSGSQLLATIKSMGLNAPKGVHTRIEIERPVEDTSLWEDAGALDPLRLPDDVRNALNDGLTPACGLLPICRLEQTRDKRRLAVQRKVRGQIKSRPLAELSIDQVVVLQPTWQTFPLQTGDGQTLVWAAVGEFDELEVELDAAAPRQELKQIAARLREMPGLTPNWQNKLQRGLTLMAAHPLAGEEMTRCHTAELCRSVWRQQLAVMLMNEAGGRFSDDIEYIHDMRVATRRARAAARLYADFFQEKAVAAFVKRLRTTGRLLGAVRDLDVTLARMDAFRDEMAAGEDKGLDSVGEEWRKQRGRAHAALLKWLDSRKYRRFVAQFSVFCQTPGAGVKSFSQKPGKPPRPHQVRHVIPSMLMNRYEAVRAFEAIFEAGEPVPVKTLHALRIECKYLRYHLEFASGLLGAEGVELIEALRQLQERLGLLNDAAVSSEMLAGRASDSAGVGRYRAAQVSALRELSAALPADLAAFLSPETRRKLALALARI